MDSHDPSVEVVNESTRQYVINAGPIKPIIDFLRSSIGQREFWFQSRWFDEYLWLEYSVKKDAAFCFYCRCFGSLGKDFPKLILFLQLLTPSGLLTKAFLTKNKKDTLNFTV